MSSPYWVRTLLNKTFNQRFFWSRLTRFSPIGRLVRHMLFENDEIFYLPKDQVIEINESVETEGLGGMAVPSKVLDHFIRRADFHWIMDFCICRDSSGCRDYPMELGCLFLGEAARHINPKFGRPVTMEQALAHAERCRKAGLVHLIGRNKLDTIWLGVGPPEKLLTVCNCCPCCCLWKVLPVIDERIGENVSRMPGVRVEVTDQCAGCGRCTRDVCFVGAIRIENKQAVIDSDMCRGCGRCASVCPNDAIAVLVEDADFIGRTIRRIDSAVDVEGK